MAAACPRCRSEALEARGPSASRCTSCRLVFSAQAGLLAGARAEGGAELAPPAQPITAPVGFEVTLQESPATTSYRGGGDLAAHELEMRFKWRETSATGLRDLGRVLAVAVAFSVFALFVRDRRTHIPMPEVAIAPALIALIVGYVTLAIALNRTTITLRGGRLRVRSGPLPWVRRKDIAAESIQQIYCEQYNANGGTAGVVVMALLREGDSVKISPGLGSTEHALFIEDTLERLLRIEDRPIDGEAKYRKR